MGAQVFNGYKCPRCNSTIDIDVSLSLGTPPREKPVCPACGADMEPGPIGRTIATNVHCWKCNSLFGMVTSDVCPNCGAPFV